MFSMSGYHTVKVNVRGIHVTVRKKGKGKPLLYLHGAYGYEGWPEFLDLFSESFTVFSPIQPGFLDAEGIEKINDIYDLVLFHLDLIESLDLKTPIILGHHFGAMVAGELAAVCSHNIGKLVLANPAGFWIDDDPGLDYFIVPDYEIRDYLLADPQDPSNSHILPSAGDENIELEVDKYQHVVLSWSKEEEEASFYVNDISKDLKDLPAITIPSGDGHMIVAKSAGIEIFGLRLWDTKRSNTQISNNVRNFIKTNDNLIVSYYFDSDDDEDDGTTASKNPNPICQKEGEEEGERCGLVHESVDKFPHIIHLNDELNSTKPTLDDHYTRVPETSYFKIMSCGLGPLDTMVSMESIMKFEKFNDISAIKVGEKFL